LEAEARAYRQHHFQDAATQEHAARLGMWLFLGTEVLLFAGLFVAYAYYRTLHGAVFAQASRHLATTLGTLETLDLVTSSFCMVMAVHFARTGQARRSLAALGATMALGAAFLLMHSVEYAHEFHEGALPGRLYHFAALPAASAPAASLFYTIYFFMTGLHSLHVIAGISVLGWLAWRTRSGDFSATYSTPVELGGLYWHLVDLIWIFLYPLLYLI
jgi:cytochrome c oxidase subunit 3